MLHIQLPGRLIDVAAIQPGDQLDPGHIREGDYIHAVN